MESERKSPECPLAAEPDTRRFFIDGVHAVLAARRPRGPMLNAALAIEPDKRKLFVGVVLAVLPPRARKEVEAIMLEKYEYQSEYARRYVAEGRAEGKAEDVLRVLEARGFAVPKEAAERVLACRDLEMLHAWLVRAATLADLDAILSSE